MELKLNNLLDIMSKTTETIRKEIVKSFNESKKDKGSIDFYANHLDTVAQETFLNLILKEKIDFMLVSEDYPDAIYGDSPKYIIILDPIDGTDLAVRNLYGATTNVLVLDYETKDPLLSVTSDIMFNRNYYASQEEGSFCDGIRVYPSKVCHLSDALISIYATKKERLLGLANQEKIIRNSYRIHNYGASLSMANVGSGSVDAVIEYNKGFMNLDYGASLYFAEKAGAYVRDLEGNRVKISADKNVRQKFIISSTQELYEDIIKNLFANR